VAKAMTISRVAMSRETVTSLPVNTQTQCDGTTTSIFVPRTRFW
jgi:hypothetical protein